MKSFLRLIHCTALLMLSVPACSNPQAGSQSPPPQARPSSGKTKDFSHRRITGRQSLPLAAGVRVHADRMFTGEDGTIQFKGRVFLEASASQASVHESVFGWPIYSYADEAAWNDARKELTLQGHVALELKDGFIIEGTQNQTAVTVNGSHLKVVGPTRTRSYSQLRKL